MMSENTSKISERISNVSNELENCAKPIDGIDVDSPFSEKINTAAFDEFTAELAKPFDLKPPTVRAEPSDSFKKISDFDYANNANIPDVVTINVEPDETYTTAPLKRLNELTLLYNAARKKDGK